jgi:hypothetical protein
MSKRLKEANDRCSIQFCSDVTMLQQRCDQAAINALKRSIDRHDKVGIGIEIRAR